MVYFATAKYGFGCSVQITASHNPREYNGLKVSRKEALPVGLESGLGEIERWIAQGKETPKSATPGKVICKDIKAEYLQFQRIGYFMADKNSTADHLVFNKTVGLKDTWAKMADKK